MGIIKPRFVRCFLAVLTLVFGIEMGAKNIEVNYEVFVDEVVDSVAKSINKKLGLNCIGTGGRMPRDVEAIGIKFMSDRPASIEIARKLELIAIEDLLLEVNHHKKLRPFLREFPFKADRVRVSISFFSESDGLYFKNSVAYASLVKNRITYCVYDEAKEELVEIAEESYDDALKNYQNSMNKAPKPPENQSM